MTIGFIYWLLLIIAFVFGGYRNRDTLGVFVAYSLLSWILFVLLGIAEFGFPIK